MRVHPQSNVFVIAVSGDLDLVSLPLLDAAVDSVLRGSWALVVVDMAELRFVDVAGAAALRRLVTSLPAPRRAVLMNADPLVAATLTSLGLDLWLVSVEQLPFTTDAELAELLGS